MTNFELFREHCKTTKKFKCHIFYKDNRFRIIDNDLTALEFINESDVFYFQGSAFAYDNATTGAIYAFPEDGEVYKSGSVVRFDINDEPAMTMYACLEVDILYELYNRGIDLNIIEALIPTLYNEWREEEIRDFEDETEFQNYWKKLMKKWEDFKNEKRFILGDTRQ